MTHFFHRLFDLHSWEPHYSSSCGRFYTCHCGARHFGSLT